MPDYICEFFAAVCTSPTLESILVFTDAIAGPESKQVAHQLQDQLALKGVAIDFHLIEGLHDRDLYFIGDTGTWRVQSDRGIDYFQRGPMQCFLETARCKRTKIEITKLAVSPAELQSPSEMFSEMRSRLDHVDLQILERWVADKSVSSLRRKLRSVLGLTRRLQAGEVLDAWQQKKCRQHPTILAALRLKKQQEQCCGSVGQPISFHASRSPANSTDSDEQTQAASLAEVVRHGQRFSAYICRAWAKFCVGWGWNDPRKYGRKFLVKFLRSLPSSLRVPWGEDHHQALECENIPHSSRETGSRSHSFPAWAQTQAPSRGRSLPQRCIINETHNSCPARSPGSDRLYVSVPVASSPIQEAACPPPHEPLPAVPLFPGQPATIGFDPGVDGRRLSRRGQRGIRSSGLDSRTESSRGRYGLAASCRSRDASVSSLSSASSCRTWVSATARGRRGSQSHCVPEMVGASAIDIPAGPEFDEDLDDEEMFCATLRWSPQF